MRLIIVGANGKLGKLVLAQAARDSSIEIVGQVSRSFNNTAPFFNSINNINSACDCILDVSHPDNLSEILAYAQNHHTPLVIATTGFNVSQVEQINTAARQIPILLTSNTSLGVFSFRQLVAKATKLLNNWDIEIVETHHNQKADAPSGTAKTIIEDIRQVRELNPISNRTGKRQPNEIGIVALRGGTVPGTHTVNFFGDNETITLTHQAQSRVIFAQGAIECCTIMENQKENKLFRMEDILKLGGEQC